jgi:hypothetical protein
MFQLRSSFWLASSIVLLAACSTEAGRPSDSNESSVTSLSSGTTADETSTTNATSTGVKLDLPDEDGDLPSATTGDCVSESTGAETTSLPVDIILVVDTSFSMAPAISAVQNSINVDFAAILEQSGVDYRVIVLGGFSNTQVPICISAPLSGTDCNPPPAAPALTDRYKHYDAETGSGAFLNNIVSWYATPDQHGFAPGGYRDFLRPDAVKVFLGMTDGTSASDDTSAGESFDAALLNLQPPVFGTPGNRQYKFHVIVSMPANVPVEEPWLADDPIQGFGGSLQQVAIITDGWRYPLEQTQVFPLLFQQIAEDVIATTPVACEFPIPEAPMGMIDPDTIEIDYSPNGQPPPIPFHQVVDLAACEPEAFYIANDTVILCPDACALVQADPNAKLDVRYGCDVGYDPQG